MAPMLVFQLHNSLEVGPTVTEKFKVFRLHPYIIIIFIVSSWNYHIHIKMVWYLPRFRERYV